MNTFLIMPGFGGDYGSMMFGYGLGGGIIGAMFMVAWWAIVIGVIVIVVRWFADQTKRTNNKKTPLDVLKERYAKGEITKEEFESKKKDLEG